MNATYQVTREITNFNSVYRRFCLRIFMSPEFWPSGAGWLFPVVSRNRVSIISFPDYKHILQENYCTWNRNIFLKVWLKKLFFYNTSVHFNMCSFRCTENVYSKIDDFFFVMPQNTPGFLLHWRHFDTSRLCNCDITINTWHKILETNLSNGKKISLYSCISGNECL